MPGFPKSERITSSAEFSRLYKAGKKAFSKNFFLTFVDADARRIGITVSAKVGNATVRNRIKRVVREFFRLNKEMFPLVDCVITAKTGAGRLASGEIREEMAAVVKKMK